MRVFFVSMFIGLGICLSATPRLWAGEVDVLLDALVDKGILSPIEAATIRTETEKSVADELKTGSSYAVPKWVQNIKFKGDLRTRYQYEKREMSSSPRHRERIRARLGAIAKITSDIEAGIGLASGSSDPRSTNQTLQDTFSSKGINLDYAYFKWLVSKVEGLTLVGGKFERKDYLWVPTDLLWDGDINPEGASVNYKRTLAEGIDLWLNTGIWVLDEKSSERDPYLKYVQVGLSGKQGKVSEKFAVTYYAPENLTGNILDNASGTNSNSSVELVSNYNAIALGTEIGFKEPFGGLPYDIDQYVALFGEYVQNLDDDVVKTDLTGHSFGFKFGHKKVAGPKTWQFKYIKAKLGRDAWIDAFPDSDRWGGATDIESHEGILEIGLTKNVNLGLDYYKSWRKSAPDNKERLFQADVVFKF